MKRAALMLTVVALGLTACTDQPTAPEPSPTATVTETVTAHPADDLPSEEHIVDTIATVLQQPDAAELPQGAAALAEFGSLLSVSSPDQDGAEQAECDAVFETQPEVAGFGAADLTDEESTDEENAASALTALGFASATEAIALTEELQQFVELCASAGTEIKVLTHHTDEAFEIQVEHSEDEMSSVVVVRNTNWVFAAASTPGTDVGLALTLVDQLDEMLR